MVPADVTKFSPLVDYLRQRAHATFGMGYEAFVLRYGREFIAAPRPKGIRKRRAGQCFKNAWALADRDRSYIYVEGWATGTIPQHHAWCVTRDGVAVDPTWNQEQAVEYFGVPFQLIYVAKTILAFGVFGIFNDGFNKALAGRPDEVDVAEIVESLLP